MKNTILILIPFLVLTGCGKTVDLGDLQERGGVYYEVGSDVGYTGKFEKCGTPIPENALSVIGHEDEYKAIYEHLGYPFCEEGNLKDGKLDGLVTKQYDKVLLRGKRSGGGKIETNYKDGIKEGTETKWYSGGQKKYEANFKNGKGEGLYTEWYDNGQKALEINYKDGNKEGLYTEWNKNGQKELEENYKNGEKQYKKKEG